MLNYMVKDKDNPNERSRLKSRDVERKGDKIVEEENAEKREMKEKAERVSLQRREMEADSKRELSQSKTYLKIVENIEDRIGSKID